MHKTGDYQYDNISSEMESYLFVQSKYDIEIVFYYDEIVACLHVFYHKQNSIRFCCGSNEQLGRVR